MTCICCSVCISSAQLFKGTFPDHFSGLIQQVWVETRELPQMTIIRCTWGAVVVRMVLNGSEDELCASGTPCVEGCVQKQVTWAHFSPSTYSLPHSQDDLENAKNCSLLVPFSLKPQPFQFLIQVCPAFREGTAVVCVHNVLKPIWAFSLAS
jgi:hypothetical protein